MLLFTVSIAMFNYVGISVTKYVSAAARAVLDSIRTVLVWLFFLTMPFVPVKAKEYFSYLQAAGFIFLIIGTILFNEVLVLPCCGFNLYTREMLKKRAIEEGTYQPTSEEENVQTSEERSEK